MALPSDVAITVLQETPDTVYLVLPSTGDTLKGREPGQEVRRPGRWTCRLHLWHRWRTHRYPNVDDRGGERYQECLDCGKQRDVPVGGGTWIAGQDDDD